jgi:hypothetical protein
MMGESTPRAALIYQHATAERDRAHAGYLGALSRLRSVHASPRPSPSIHQRRAILAPIAPGS